MNEVRRYDDPEYQKQVSLQMLATPTHLIACRAITDLRQENRALVARVRAVEREADEIAQLQARLTASEAALRDCLALARRRQRTDMAGDWSHIIRFCDQAGIKPDGTLRQGPLTPGE